MATPSLFTAILPTQKITVNAKRKSLYNLYTIDYSLNTLFMY